MSRTPVVIAHRGASGYLPEHTREAKALAYGQGADYLEQDVVATRDGRLVVLHDLTLDDVTDVAVRFPARRRADGRFYVIDFDVEELKSLRIVERRREGTDQRLFPQRFGDDELEFRVVTFDEEIRFVRALNATTGRRVGLYPEIKAPAFHRDHGVDLTALLLETLERFGYSRAEDAVIVQCFDADELRRCRHEFGTGLRLAQLSQLGPNEKLPAGMLSIAAEYAQIWAPPYTALLRPRDPSATVPGTAETAEEARRAGLELHPYTFRLEAVPPCFDSFERQLEFFYSAVGIDGLFCDHPDVAVRVREQIKRGALGGA